MAAFQRQPSPFSPNAGAPSPTGPSIAQPRPPAIPGSAGASTTMDIRTPSTGGNTAQPRPRGSSASAQGPYSGSPNPGRSGSDPRGRVQNQGNYQQQRFESQMDPTLGQFAQNYGRGAEQGFQDYGKTMQQFGTAQGQYGNVMNTFGQLAGPQGYGAFTETGGYSPSDMANMRSRGVSPIRAAYSNAEREVGRQRSLQGGYSPNATATLAKMAREQGQAGSDAATSVEAQIAQMKQSGKLAGMQGQLGAAQGQLGAAGGMANVGQGMAGLYGATPGMASTFGNQLMSGLNTNADFGMNLMRNDIAGQELPGQWDTTTGRINDIATMAGNAAYPWLNRTQQPQSPTPAGNAPGTVPRNNIFATTPGTMPQSSIFNQQSPPPYGGTPPPIAPPLGGPAYGGGYEPGFGAPGQQQPQGPFGRPWGGR